MLFLKEIVKNKNSVYGLTMAKSSFYYNNSITKEGKNGGILEQTFYIIEI